MDAFFSWLSSNPVVANVLIVALGAVVLSVVLIYLVAFFQGREVSFWPPKLGKKPVTLSSAQARLEQAKVAFSEWDASHLRQRLASASEVSMMVIANYDLMTNLAEEIEDFLRRGGQLRCILIKPGGKAVKMVAIRSIDTDVESDPDHIRKQIRMSLDKMQAFAKSAPGSESVEVKTIDYLHSAVITMIDHHSPAGTMYVTLNGFGQYFTSRPSFILSKDKEAKWFKFFQEAFENMWRSPACESVKLVE
jgi:hypothetical protein